MFPEHGGGVVGIDVLISTSPSLTLHTWVSYRFLHWLMPTAIGSSEGQAQHWCQMVNEFRPKDGCVPFLKCQNKVRGELPVFQGLLGACVLVHDMCGVCMGRPEITVCSQFSLLPSHRLQGLNTWHQVGIASAFSPLNHHTIPVSRCLKTVTSHTLDRCPTVLLPPEVINILMFYEFAN